MKITNNTDVMDVGKQFWHEWINVKLKNGKKLLVYAVDVDLEFETEDSVENAIVYNRTGSNRNGEAGILFSQIDSIELADPPKTK